MLTKEFIEKHQTYLYNLALRLVYDKQDAQDLTHDVWIKIIENIDSFEGKSNFSTWSYRIMMNHFFNQQRKYTQLDFKNFANTMNNLEDMVFENEYKEPQKQLLIEEAKIGCMMGMLLCLNPEQRAILVVGDIFEIDSNIASEIFDISKENFRKKLSRVRKELYGFMNTHCSLVNKKNNCNCERKTKALIKEGYVEPTNIKFAQNTDKILKKQMKIKSDTLDNTMEYLYQNLYQNHPLYEIDSKLFATNLLKNHKIKEIFEI